MDGNAAAPDIVKAVKWRITLLYLFFFVLVTIVTAPAATTVIYA